MQKDSLAITLRDEPKPQVGHNVPQSTDGLALRRLDVKMFHQNKRAFHLMLKSFPSAAEVHNNTLCLIEERAL